jgi:phospholipid transport system substrate-binding protein
MTVRRAGMRTGLTAGVALALYLAFSAAAFAGVPLDTVKSHVTAVIDVLRDPSFKGEAGAKAKREKIRVVAGNLFDFVELSKRTLGANWNNLNPEQRKEFVALYRSILEDTYVDRITAYTDEKVNFTKEVPLSESTVEVQSVIVTKKSDVPIYYRVIKRGDGWKVYDVVIEGVSLISNYRSQFREILAKGEAEALLDTLCKKVGKK